mgnify:CR=1 FL=1
MINQLKTILISFSHLLLTMSYLTLNINKLILYVCSYVCRRRRRHHLGREDVFVVDEPSWAERRRRVLGQVESTTHTIVDDSGMMALRPNIRSRQPDIISQEAM